MDHLEIKAEIFKIVRANAELKPKAIIDLIKLSLPDVSLDLVAELILELSE